VWDVPTMVRLVEFPKTGIELLDKTICKVADGVDPIGIESGGSIGGTRGGNWTCTSSVLYTTVSWSGAVSTKLSI